MHIRGFLAIKQHQASPLNVAPPTVQLGKYAMSLFAWDVVIMDPNCLALNELVDRTIDTLAEPGAKYSLHFHSQVGEEPSFREELEVRW